MKKQEIEVTDVVVIRRRIPLDNYPGMTAEQAREYETNLEEPERVENAVELLSADEPEVFARVVRIVDTDVPEHVHSDPIVGGSVPVASHVEYNQKPYFEPPLKYETYEPPLKNTPLEEPKLQGLTLTGYESPRHMIQHDGQ